MKDPGALQQVYADLADRFARQGQLRNRDHCLVLAAAAALAAGRADEAERLRQRLLHANPYHLLRPDASLQEALQIKDIREYVEDLRRQWPPDAARKVHSLPDLPAPGTRVEPPPVFKAADTHAPRKSQVDAAQPVGGKTLPAPVIAPDPPRAVTPRKSAPVIAMAAVPSPYEPLPLNAPAPAPADVASPLAQWAATMLFFLAAALSAGVAFTAFVWPLMD